MAELSPSQSMHAAALASPPDALAELRAATAELHARLDSQLPLSQETACLADYARHVTIIDAWLAEIDRLGFPESATPPGWAQAQSGRRQRIASDIAETAGAGEMPASGAARQGDTSTPDTHAPGFAWGVAYVVEGSQLGGQMLYRRLREPLAPHALHYLRGDGVSGQWPRFIAALREALATPEAIQGALTGALWAFASLIERFERAGAMA